MSRLTQFILLASTTAAACATTTPGAKPHDMSAAEHERAAAAHASASKEHADQYDPEAKAERVQCAHTGSYGGSDAARPCWTAIINPTKGHIEAAEEHRRHAADHRAASAALRDAEARACVGLHPDDRDFSPFDHVEDITSIAPLKEPVATTVTGPSGITGERTVGAAVTFRAVPGLTAEWLQRIVDCHIARNASLGHSVPEMPNCPLVPRGVQARVRSTGSGFAVEIRSDDEATVREILSRAERLRPGTKLGSAGPR